MLLVALIPRTRSYLSTASFQDAPHSSSLIQRHLASSAHRTSGEQEEYDEDVSSANSPSRPKLNSPWLKNEDRHGLDQLVYSKLIALWKPDPLVNPLASSITLPRAIRVHGLSAAMSLRSQTTDIRQRFSSRERENSEVAPLHLSLGRISIHNSYNTTETLDSVSR